MPFIPHTADEIHEMLEAIGVGSIDQLFGEIPEGLRSGSWKGLPPALSELEIARLMRERADEDGSYLNFIGAGAYEHHIPAAVWQIATRGEIYSAYTPYQAEASQGTLQLIYEYQSMMASLTAMDVANASLYDGASALAEAVLMAVRIQKSARRVLMPRSVHPVWQKVVRSIVRNQGIEIIDVPYSGGTGCVQMEDLSRHAQQGLAALVVQQPNFFGLLEPADELANWAHDRGALAIGAVNPVSLAIVKPPGNWGAAGADIAVGDGQPLGIPLSGGGPYFGFMACRRAYARQMPGRIVGRTSDAEGRVGFALTLQAREQHIRRSKATSNICTNQGLMVAAATIHMALLGRSGLTAVANSCHANALRLLNGLAAVDGVARVFPGAMFHEFVLRLKTPVAPVLRALRAQGILGGLSLARDYPELGHTLLVCATESRNEDDLKRYVGNMGRIVGKRLRPAPCAPEPGP